MMWCNWNDLPQEMRCAAVKPYYDSLNQRKGSLFLKFLFDKVLAALLLIILSPIYIVLAILIRMDSEGPIFFRQERVTQYGRTFSIYKFRTMVHNAESLGAQVTSQHDSRITKIGEVLRKYRLDELPQLLNILEGTMSFVGTRPEVPRYVSQYTDEMKATLLLPAGVTSKASIEFKDEDRLLSNATDVDHTYIKEVLPKKMSWNLKGIVEFSFVRDIQVMVETVLAVIR